MSRSRPLHQFDSTFIPDFNDGVVNETGIKKIAPVGIPNAIGAVESLTFQVPKTAINTAYDMSGAYFHVTFQMYQDGGNVTDYTPGTATTHATLANSGWALFKEYIEQFGSTQLIYFADNTPALEHIRSSVINNSNEDFQRMNEEQWLYDPATDDVMDSATSSFGLRAARTSADQPITLKLPLLGRSVNRRLIPLVLPNTKAGSGYEFTLKMASNEEMIQRAAETIGLDPEVEYSIKIKYCYLVIPTIRSNNPTLLESAKAVLNGSPQTFPISTLTYFKSKSLPLKTVADNEDETTVNYESTGCNGRIKNVFTGLRRPQTGQFLPNRIRYISIKIDEEEYPSDFTISSSVKGDDTKITSIGNSNLFEWHEIGYGSANRTNSTLMTFKNWSEHLQLFKVPICSLHDDVKPTASRLPIAIGIVIDRSGLTGKYEVVCGVELEGLVAMKIDGDAATGEDLVKYSRRL